MGVVIPLASRIHGPDYYRSLLRSVEDFFRNHNIRVLDVLDSDELVTSDVVDAVRDPLPILLILTGGTSRLAWRLLSLSNVRRAVIIAHSRHNSLPSAISVKSRADVEGIPTRIYFCRDVVSSDCSSHLNEVVELSNSVTQLSSIRVAVVSNAVDESYNLFEGVLGIKTSSVSYEELEKLFSEVGVEEVGLIGSKLKMKLDLVGVEEESFKDALKVYLALKRLVELNNFNALALDCFPFLIKYRITPCLAVSLLNDDGIPVACEGDLRSLLSMLIAKAVGSWPVWIANISSVEGNRMVLAHCTVATKLARQCRLITHFESNYPYSLSCSLPSNTYTLVGIDREFTTMATLTVRLVDSGSLFDRMCRTQAVVESDVDLSYFPNIALSNHHVLIPGNLNLRLKDIGYMLGLEVITYESVIKYLMEG